MPIGELVVIFRCCCWLCVDRHAPGRVGRANVASASLWLFFFICVCECACDNLSHSLYFMYYKRNDVLFNASVHVTTVFYSVRALSAGERARPRARARGRGRERFLLLLLPSAIHVKGLWFMGFLCSLVSVYTIFLA